MALIAIIYFFFFHNTVHNIVWLFRKNNHFKFSGVEQDARKKRAYVQTEDDPSTKAGEVWASHFILYMLWLYQAIYVPATYLYHIKTGFFI